MNSNLYEILGVSYDAPASVIKKAYYRLSKLYHPDTGNEKNSEKFEEIKTAYETLSNDESRKYYDENGSIKENGPNEKQEVQSFIGLILAEVLKTLPDDWDEWVIHSQSVSMARIDNHIQELKRNIERVENFKKRLKGRPTEDLLTPMIEQKIKVIQKGVDQTFHQKDIMILAYKVLNEYSFEEVLRQGEYVTLSLGGEINIEGFPSGTA